MIKNFWCDYCEDLTDYGELRICCKCNIHLCDYHFEKISINCEKCGIWKTCCCKKIICLNCSEFTYKDKKHV